MDPACPNHCVYVGRRISTHELCPSRSFPTDDMYGRIGAGMNIDYKSALMACIGESIERYCSSLIPFEELTWTSELDIVNSGKECMSSKDLDYFTDEQYWLNPYLVQWMPTSLCYWRECYSMKNGRPYYIPAQLIYVPYKHADGEGQFCEQVSTGLACHRSETQAQLSGLYEVIERDAFMIYWLTMASVPSVEIESLAGWDHELNALLNRVKDIPTLTLTLKDITIDAQIPTMLCIARNPNNSEAVAAAFAAATDLNPVIAVRKALNELLGTYALAHRLRFDEKKADQLKIGPQRWNKTVTNNDHVLNFTISEILAYIEWIDTGPTVKLEHVVKKYPYGSANSDISTKTKLDICIERLDNCGLEAFCTDISCPDILDANYRVIRVFIPRCVPLNGVHKCRPLGCHRLQEIPKKLGWKCEGRINVVPHPYP